MQNVGKYRHKSILIRRWMLPVRWRGVWGAQDDAVSISTVHAVLDHGINFFDTAECYNDDSHLGHNADMWNGTNRMR